MVSSRHPRFSPSGSRQARARLPARSPLSMEDAFTLLQAGMASLSTARQASGARRDATFGGKCEWDHTVAGADVTADDVTEEPLVTSYRQRGPTPRRPVCAPQSSGPPSKYCYYCGEKHGKAPFLARNQVCKSYGKRGHVKKVCWAAKTQDMAINSVTVGGVAVASEPLLQVSVTLQAGGTETTVTAVADTGAQVCVAGPKLMSLLGLRPALLQRQAGIRDLARILLSSLGAAACHISLPSHTTVQDVHFVENVERLYLSCTTCKDLGLIHQAICHNSRTWQHLRPAPEVPQASDTEDLAPLTPLPPLSPPSPAPRMDGEGRHARWPPKWLKDYVQ
ncbi:hypothetical protein O3P69_001794 [Scylla paramamosain]|uniref:Peptidase A2 domain-containing protein n=1 Tax=Scylla paramamosain TaxID=85552 RepID=A0AAW0UZL9_SCYPA